MPQNSSLDHFHARPNSIPWPPLVLLFSIATGWLLNVNFPALAGQTMVGLFPLKDGQVGLGWLIVGLAIGMDLWVLIIFRRHNTNIRPDRPAESLVTSGPFGYSRNPIYVGNVAIVLGLALARGSLWYLLLAPCVFYLIRELAIKPEEKHMTSRFSDQWVSYASHVRRWL